MGLISARFRKKKDDTLEPAVPEPPQQIKRYRVQSAPAGGMVVGAKVGTPVGVGVKVGAHSPPMIQGQTQAQISAPVDPIGHPIGHPVGHSAGHPARPQPRPLPQHAHTYPPTQSLTHRDDFGDVTQLWKRGSIRILEPSDMSNSSASMWSEPSLETQLSFKRGPQQPVQVQNTTPASPTFSMCGSTHSLSPSPSLDYSASFSSDASVASRLSVHSLGRQHEASSNSKVDAGIPPLLPAHRTFSGSPHHGSFYRPKHKHTKSAASDYIPLHVFTREPRAAPSAPLEPAKLRKRFNLDGYQGGLKVVNITPPSSPPPALEPGRYRVPSKASLMDH